jgi:hypothetical protein
VKSLVQSDQPLFVFHGDQDNSRIGLSFWLRHLVIDNVKKRFIPLLLPIDRLMDFTNTNERRVLAGLACAFLAGVSVLLSGCHDGPLYGLKVVNPYYSQKQWKEDEKYGLTDHQRRKELNKLVTSLPRLPKQRQAYWLEQLNQIMEHDESPEMRRIAVLAAGQLNDATADNIVRDGLKDQSVKVRLACCETLGARKDAEATRMLAEAAGSSTDQDVRQAAFTALGKHKGPLATDALKLALEDRDPATRSIAMSSLRSSTGKNYGNDPEVWIAALQGKEVKEQPVRFAERIENLIR